MTKHRWLKLLCLAEVGTMLVLLNYSAVLPVIQAEWGLSNTQAGLIYSAYQIGYILLVVVLSTLTDYMDAKKYMCTPLCGPEWQALYLRCLPTVFILLLYCAA
ncbi:hypothetical protein [Dethiobacter alkaliphilus]|uniref:MFS transporter n=1 Tax=Dethiobacter alkaliphilus AHT 1 TaxID=555088 RepID=C0GIN5_DETAL|nr:hypothetical protein [Dethiobacter alkaliphilus]EEG76699.1 hypothetical protein DealDRAFT_2344 [Dethiobacter alkaliphilus AHT 1]